MSVINQGFESVVSINGDAKYKSIVEAINAGNKSIYVRNGVYIEPSDIIIPEGGQLVGESFGSVYIVGKSVKIDGNNGVYESSGTISINNGSTLVTGVGTTFTNLSAGQYISVANNFMEIDTVTNDTTLNLKVSYRGKNISGNTYLAQTMYNGIRIKNFIVANSPAEGVFVRGVKQSSISNIACVECTGSGFKFSEMGDCVINTLVATNGISHGIEVINSVDLLLDVCNVYNNSGIGIKVGGTSNFISVSRATCTCNSSYGIHITDTSTEVILLNSYSKLNNADGMKTDSTTSDITFTGCICTDNNGNGILIDSPNSVIVSNISRKNSANGIRTNSNSMIDNNNCTDNGGDGIHTTGDNTSIVSNTSSNNTTNGVCIEGKNCSITGNISTSNSTGINLSNTSNRNNIVSNQSTNNILSNISDAGTNNTQTNNVVDT